MSIDVLAADLAALSVERILLGSFLMDRDAIPSVSDRLNAEAFADPFHRTVYTAIQHCWERGVPTDISSVHNELAGVPAFQDGTTWTLALSDLMELMRHAVEYGWPCHATFYAEQVIEHARRRALSNAGAMIIQASSTGRQVDVAMLMHDAVSGLDQFGSVSGKKGPQSYAELIPDFQERVMRMRSGELERRETATGYGLLDRKLYGGFYPGELILLAARPGMGKTAFALQLSHNIARAGKHTLIFSAEMSTESLIRRAASEVAGVSAQAVMDNVLTDNQYDLFLQATDRLAAMPVSIDDTSGISTGQMLVRVQSEQRKHDLGLVVFDYIELAGDKAEAENENLRITAIVRKLKHLARVCDVPMMALCQLNRGVETRTNRRPGLADLRSSGSLEQEADKVLFLYRHSYYVGQGLADPEVGKENTCEVIIAKHRQGPTGDVSLFFREDTMSFHDLTSDPETRNRA